MRHIGGLAEISRSARPCVPNGWNEDECMIQQHHSATLQLQELRTAARKTLTIEISDADLTTLKKSNYKLCFAKKVNEGEYNVVWETYQYYSTYVDFCWEPSYQIFACKQFTEDMQVKVQTKTVSIGLNQTCRLDQNLLMHDAQDGGYPTALTLLNEFTGEIHPGVNQVSTDENGVLKSKPIYVSPMPSILGTVKLTPVELVQVWFAQDIQTGTMFSHAVSNAYEADLTDTNTIHLKFENQRWRRMED